jgi:hypothetical protein
MVDLSFLNISFVRTLEIAAEIGRVFIALDFKPPPPEYTYRGLEPIYKDAIQHVQDRTIKKYKEISKNDDEKLEEGACSAEATQDNEQKFDELEVLLDRHGTSLYFDQLCSMLIPTIARLIGNMNSLLQHPHLHPRKHSDEWETLGPNLDTQLGPERYIDPPFKGYGFSNDYIRQWLAIIPGPLGRRFETEEAGKANLTRIFQQIVVAFTGGASLLVPMIIMTFVQGINHRLIIVSVATVRSCLLPDTLTLLTRHPDSIWHGVRHREFVQRECASRHSSICSRHGGIYWQCKLLIVITCKFEVPDVVWITPGRLPITREGMMMTTHELVRHALFEACSISAVGLNWVY